MRGRHRNAAVIQIYAPDTNHDDGEVEDSYSRVEEELERTHEGDLVTVMRDFNCKTGSGNQGSQGYEEVIGGHEQGERKDRGMRMLEFCQHNYVSPTCISAIECNRHGRHQISYIKTIDYVLIGRKRKSSVLNTKEKRSRL